MSHKGRAGPRARKNRVLNHPDADRTKAPWGGPRLQSPDEAPGRAGADMTITHTSPAERRAPSHFLSAHRRMCTYSRMCALPVRSRASSLARACFCPLAGTHPIPPGTSHQAWDDLACTSPQVAYLASCAAPTPSWTSSTWSSFIRWNSAIMASRVLTPCCALSRVRTLTVPSLSSWAPTTRM